MNIHLAKSSDRDPLHAALTACGAFSAEEITVALEILDAGIQGGQTGDYPAFVAEIAGQARGYICVGKTPLTQSTWHLYWLCIHPSHQHQGLARALLTHAEKFVASTGGQRIVIETSGRPDYHRARRFYEKAGYTQSGQISDFYKPGDDCVIYNKRL